MAYFPNGTAGLMYQERFCVRCRNYRDKDDGRGQGCAVWDAHLLSNYDAVDNKDLRTMLGILIPEGEDPCKGPKECAMFLDDGRDHATLPMFPEGL